MKVSFVFGSTHVSVIWVILLPLAVGIVLGVLLSQATPPRGKRRSASRGDALGDLVGRDEAEREPQRVGLAAEVGARDERDACRLGAGEQLGRVDAVELEPEEVAALRPRRTRMSGSSRSSAASIASRRAPQQAAHALEVRLEEPARDELVARSPGRAAPA